MDCVLYSPVGNIGKPRVSRTDSNILTYGSLYKYLTENVLQTKLYKSKEKMDSYKMRVLNVLSNFSTTAITERLWEYCGTVNIAEEDRKHIKMKNEFYYTRMIVTFAKKSYVGLQHRQEEVIFKEPKLDVKGVNFFKSTASEDTSKFIYDEILMKRLLDPPSGEVSLRDTYKAIDGFKKNMAKEIKAGNTGYLKRSIRVKTADGYANPLGIGQYKAVYVWNKIVPDKDRIDLPATVTLVKVVLRNKQDAAPLEKWPKIYEKVIELFDTNPEIGDSIDKDGKIKKGKGIKAIAMPSEYDEVPEWLLSIIDVQTLIADNMALFGQLSKSLGLSSATRSATSPYYTNIVRL